MRSSKVDRCGLIRSSSTPAVESAALRKPAAGRAHAVCRRPSKDTLFVCVCVCTCIRMNLEGTVLRLGGLYPSPHDRSYECPCSHSHPFLVSGQARSNCARPDQARPARARYLVWRSYSYSYSSCASCRGRPGRVGSARSCLAKSDTLAAPMASITPCARQTLAPHPTAIPQHVKMRVASATCASFAFDMARVPSSPGVRSVRRHCIRYSCEDALVGLEVARRQELHP